MFGKRTPGAAIGFPAVGRRDERTCCYCCGKAAACRKTSGPNRPGRRCSSPSAVPRAGDLLLSEADHWRDAVACTRRERPFGIAAWVVLPDHLHCVWQMPLGDRDFSTRWGAIKARFSMQMRRAGFVPPLPVGHQNGGVNPALRHLPTIKRDQGMIKGLGSVFAFPEISVLRRYFAITTFNRLFCSILV